MSEQGSEENNGAGGGRLRRLRTVVRGNSDVEARNVGQLVGGGLLMAGGLVVILFAWYGSAHTAYVQQQIPYLVSGSFIGLGMMTVGGLLFWAHWLYRIYDQADLHHREYVQQQREMTEAVLQALAAAPASSRGRAAAATASKASSATASVSSYVATSAGSNFHVPECPIVSKSRNGLRKVTHARSCIDAALPHLRSPHGCFAGLTHTAARAAEQ